MASSLVLPSLSSVPLKSYRNHNRNRTQSQFLCPKSLYCFNRQSLSLSSGTQFRSLALRHQKPRYTPVVLAVQSNFLKVLQKAWTVGKDGIEAATDFVPGSVPRPIAKVSVTFVALAVSLYVFKAFLSTAFFVLATMGLVYFIFIALNKDEGPKGGGGGGGGGGGRGTASPDDSLEEARRIMEKYK